MNCRDYHNIIDDASTSSELATTSVCTRVDGRTAWIHCMAHGTSTLDTLQQLPSGIASGGHDPPKSMATTPPLGHVLHEQVGTKT